MVTISLLILAAFLQATVIPVNLVLIILICRSYIRPERANLILAFAFGLLASHLTLGNLGLNSLIYLVLVQLAQAFSKTRFSVHSLLVVPMTFILLSGYELVYSMASNASPGILPGIFTESIIALPVFYLIKLWEERFIVQKDIKLKFK